MNREDLPEPVLEKLENMEFQYGGLAGKLAMAMDLSSDAEISAGLLAVFCHNNLDPRRPHPDLEALLANVRAIRMLVKEAFREEQARKG